MKRRGRSLVDRFLASYPDRLGGLRRLADEAERTVRDTLYPLNLELHLVTSRPKELNAAIAKIRRKNYGNPGRQLTDRVGVRVVVYYADDVDRVVEALRTVFEVDERRSVDKRGELQVRQFGYRSMHLVVRFRQSFGLPPSVARLWFEIQIRSVLEHAWAEIEHEICYKSGVEYPEPLLRRFGALAGALEILDFQFTALRLESSQLVDDLKTEYQARANLDAPLDTARLVALLEVMRPAAPGWRATDGDRRRFRPQSAAACTEALKAAGLGTARRLLRTLRKPRTRGLIRAFAAANRLAADEVSHVALSIIAVGSTRPTVLRRFPDLLGDSSLRALIPSAAAV